MPSLSSFDPFNMDSPQPTLSPLAPLEYANEEAMSPEHQSYQHPTICEGSTRKRQRQLSNPHMDLAASWGYHPTFGTVVHSGICSICNAYTDHMNTSRNNFSFQQAISERDKRLDTYFFDGFAEGRRHQRDDDQYMYQECQNLHQKIQALQHEMNSLKNRLSIFEEEREYSVKTEAREAHVYPMQAASSERDCPTNSTTQAQQPNLTPTEGYPLPPANTYASVASNFSVGAAPYSFSDLPPRPLRLQARHPVAISTPNDLRATIPHNSGLHTRNPRTIEQLKSLMDQAHEPGNDAALAQVKTLCAKAHATPRDRKTALQRYLLANWRNSGSTSQYRPNLTSFPFNAHSVPAPATKPNPRMDDPVEVWHDYLCVHQQSWPRGVRKDHENRPYMSDLRASRAVARLRPDAVALRAEYMACVTDVFCVPGMYRQLLGKHNVRISPVVTYKSFAGQSPVTIDDIACHFADCGFTTLDATTDFEPWAQSYKESSVTQTSLSHNATAMFNA